MQTPPLLQTQRLPFPEDLPGRLLVSRGRAVATLRQAWDRALLSHPEAKGIVQLPFWNVIPYLRLDAAQSAIKK